MSYFYGIKPFKFIWNGEWSDPEIEYKGHKYNYCAIEDSLYCDFKIYCEEKEVENTDENFNQWIHNNKHLIEECIKSIMRFEVTTKKGWSFHCETVKSIKQIASRYFNRFENSIDEMTIHDKELGKTIDVMRINKIYPNGKIYRGRWHF